MLHFEYQYAEALKNCIENGVYSQNRTGVATYAIQHQYLCLENISKNFPLIKGKKVYPKMALKELMWMLNGRTDIQWLEERGVKYWKLWVNEEGTIGRSYGFQFRNFNGKDILVDSINELSRNPASRRNIINLWNHNDIDKMTLPPCFYDFHFECIPHEQLFIDDENVQSYYVDLHVKQRSADSFIGTPYDMMFVSWFLIIMSEFANYFGSKNNFSYTARNIHFTMDNFHIYENHLPVVAEYLKNLNENANNVIKQEVYISVEKNFFGTEPKYGTITSKVNHLLKCWDSDSYRSFSVCKDYNPEHEYSPIQADVAV